MDRGRVGEDRGSKETDGCPLTDHNRLADIWVYDAKMLISIGKVLGDAFHKGMEWATEEDIIEGIQHDLHLEVDVNIINSELDVAEAAMCFGDHQVGGVHLQCLFYL
jgi:hypothetical protein